ncbi:TspO/MBR family protein [Neolewinella lacunae]|uniref:Tryptophan-rich sensory protein n=1 Tax=Neolewinella lacunae TaxID=1517758 RepID=A0A923T9Y0_9BACT|nr:TspO/MBR family protein [Neolewinella lacunae]MBC6995996.1 tryptophan-rich sensory protein [Neolewinella lacunae]MDN3633170.1 TspO/MBR family protein [Neolewinella lacunae]
MLLEIFMSVMIFYGILIAVNLPAPWLGLEFESGETPKLWYAPPGYLIPIVWFVLFTLLGIGRYLLLRAGGGDYLWCLYGLALLCAAYAYYTLGFARLTNISALWFGLAGNTVVILFAAFAVYTLLPVEKTAALLTLPVIVWTAFASLIVIGELRLAKLL